MDQTVLVTVQWGLLTLFVALALSLLIPNATQSLRGYLNTGTDGDRRQAVRWVWQIQGAALSVLAALLLLTALGLADAARVSSTSGKWIGMCVLLLMPVLAHVGFLVVGFRGVRRVPPLRALRLRPAPRKRRPSSAAAGQRGPVSVSRFLNTRAADVYLWLLPDTGTLGGAGVRLPPGQEQSFSNPAGMHYLIRDRDGDPDNLEHDLYVVTAPATPGIAIIPKG